MGERVREAPAAAEGQGVAQEGSKRLRKSPGGEQRGPTALRLPFEKPSY
jgi:hypothetical protein